MVPTLIRSHDLIVICLPQSSRRTVQEILRVPVRPQDVNLSVQAKIPGTSRLQRRGAE